MSVPAMTPRNAPAAEPTRSDITKLAPHSDAGRSPLSALLMALPCPADQHAGEESSAYTHPGECGLPLLRRPPRTS